MQFKLADIIHEAGSMEINMERCDCTQYDGTIYRFDLEDGIEEWYVDGEQMVELTPGGCVTAKLANTEGEYGSSPGIDDEDTEIEIYFAKLVPLTDEDMTR